MNRNNKRIPVAGGSTNIFDQVGKEIERVPLTTVASATAAVSSIPSIAGSIVRGTELFSEEMHRGVEEYIATGMTLAVGAELFSDEEHREVVELLINKPKEKIEPYEIGILMHVRRYFLERGDYSTVEKIKKKQEEYVSDVPPSPDWFEKQIKEKDKKENSERISIGEAETNIRKYLEFVKKSDYKIPEETIKMNMKRDLDRIDENR